MFGKRHTRVLVVGAGPVGLFTACRLAGLGVTVQIVDKQTRVGTHSHAPALHPRTLRLLDELGLAKGLLDRGHRVSKIAFYDGAVRRNMIDMAALGGRFPFALVVPQHELEKALQKHLKRKAIQVLWNHRLQEIDESTNEIDLEVAKLDQAPSGYAIARQDWVISKVLHWKAEFVVGADGVNSMVRRRVGFDYAAHGPQQCFSLYEFESPEEPGDELRVIRGPQGLGVLWPLAGGRSRFSFQIDNPDLHQPTLDELNRLIAERAPWFPTVRGEIYRSSVVEFDRRLSSSFGRDRVWLAGDAAHRTSPLGVQNLNGGMVDAWELGYSIADALNNAGATRRLETYGLARNDEWNALLGLSDSLNPADGVDEWTRENASTILSSVPATGDELAKLVSSVGLKFDSSTSQPQTYGRN